MIKHTIAPIYDKNSRILILGSFPSVKSREQQFFYGHKQNRFWKVLAGILGYEVPQTIEEKKEMLLGESYCCMGCDSRAVRLKALQMPVFMR